MVEISSPARASAKDIHGQKKLATNVLSSWGGQIVLIISGFLIPRLIDRRLGQEMLGIWDFAWSLISHFALIQAGVTGSINRYVAQFRAQSDLDGLNRAVSSVAAVLRVMGVLVLLLTIACVWLMPMILRQALSGHVAEARWVVLLLGTSLSVQVSASIYGGILTGCHRWDWHNGMYALTYALMLVGMVFVVLSGYGIVGLAAVNLAGESLGRLVRIGLAYRACPGLQIKRKYISLKTAREMMRFGGKMFIRDCAGMLLGQTTSLLILSYTGPASLALFSRPTALVRTVASFINKYANVLTPTASSLHSAGNAREVQRLATNATRYNLFLCLPPIIFLCVLGSELVALWMGPKYRAPGLVAALACAQFFSMAYAPLYQVLCGLNKHGPISLVLFGGAVLGVILSFFALAWLHTGLLGVAIAFGIPWSIVNGVSLPIYACRRLEISASAFFIDSWKMPIIVCGPYTLCLFAVKFCDRGSPMGKLLWGAIVAAVSLTILYWSFVLPAPWKAKLLARLPRFSKLPSIAQ